MKRLLRKTFFGTAGVAVLMMAMACCTTRKSSAEAADVPYTVAHNYFFNNNAQIPANPKVTTQADFDRLFGMAAVMGKDGQPTPIDFHRQFVIAVVLPVTDIETHLQIGKLSSDDDRLTLHYTVKRGERQSYFTQPMELVIVDKKYDRDTVALLQD